MGANTSTSGRTYKTEEVLGSGKLNNSGLFEREEALEAIGKKNSKHKERQLLNIDSVLVSILGAAECAKKDEKGTDMY